jgi:cobalt-zinc-cadmium efflux system outer membrane protein
MSNIRNNRRGNPFPLRESLAARRLRYYVIVLVISLSLSARAQEAWTWERVKARFEANNPTLSAGHLTVEEARANEVTANLRPNPQLGIVLDQFPVFNPSILSPNSAQWTPTVTQLIERQSKRHLRYQSAQLATEATQSEAQDLERTLIFDLRDAFIRLLAAKSVLQLAQDNLAYYDKVIDVNTERYKAGDVAKIDLQRVELQRAQFQSDYQTAQVSLQQAKLDLLNLMNEKTPAGQFDVFGEFDFHDAIPDLGELRNTALSARPDLQSAQTTAHKAEVDHKLAWANGSTDPTLGLEYQRTQNINTLGIDLQIPLRIFDRNQGEKQRTRIEIDRSQRLREALQSGVFHDVDSAHATLLSLLGLLSPYRDRYIPEADAVRETISFSYAHGGASLLEFLDAQREYRDTQLAYRNLVASYLAAVNQLNFAVGREVIP